MGSATTTAIVLVSILLFFSAAGLAYEVIVLVRSGATNSWRMYVKLTPYILTVFFQLMAISEFSMRNKYLICPYIITIVFFIVVGIIIGFSFSKYDELKSEGAEAELMVYCKRKNSVLVLKGFFQLETCRGRNCSSVWL
ncbi:hypothetical protein L596_023666 [Steinernema carpocapsae]|uniref:Uncharacterized protein n=1 Tax=Steinernema carpocapsae TaxID=34508 RepID=A0A4U5MF36_STECR|nr:hypothetical protein L596_023666 [Steinernema carpocapsae]